ncbi:MAG: hypothetical protein KC561_04935 [Myxococcales bacterium]|nr:hypothetical protein [Myxococcales bacterium]
MEALIKQLIETLHQANKCPRLMVDATAEGVDVPSWVQAQWAHAMPIDLDPEYPLDLEMDDKGIHCQLSFGGPYQCFLPWTSIYVVQDRATHMGMLIERNLPSKFDVEQTENGPVLISNDRRSRSAGEVAEVSTPPSNPLQVVVADGPPVASEDAPSEQERAPEKSRDEEAQERRAAFRVIDGGDS